MTVLLWACVSAVVVGAEPKADLVLAGGRVYTLDDNNHRAEAIVVSNGRTVYVGGVEGARAYRDEGC